MYTDDGLTDFPATARCFTSVILSCGGLRMTASVMVGWLDGIFREKWQ